MAASPEREKYEVVVNTPLPSGAAAGSRRMPQPPSMALVRNLDVDNKESKEAGC
jgi:hypothetical protein